MKIVRIRLIRSRDSKTVTEAVASVISTIRSEIAMTRKHNSGFRLSDTMLFSTRLHQKSV